MTSHGRRVRLLAGAGVGMALAGAVIALAGRTEPGRALALAGMGLALWETAALTLTRRYVRASRGPRAGRT